MAPSPAVVWYFPWTDLGLVGARSIWGNEELSTLNRNILCSSQGSILLCRTRGQGPSGSVIRWAHPSGSVLPLFSLRGANQAIHSISLIAYPAMDASGPAMPHPRPVSHWIRHSLRACTTVDQGFVYTGASCACCVQALPSGERQVHAVSMTSSGSASSVKQLNSIHAVRNSIIDSALFMELQMAWLSFLNCLALFIFSKHVTLRA